MFASDRIKPITYLKENAARVAQDVANTGEPMIITQNGEATLVVQDIHSYEKTQQTLALLQIVALGKKQVERGQARPAEDVFAEFDRRQAEPRG